MTESVSMMMMLVGLICIARGIQYLLSLRKPRPIGESEQSPNDVEEISSEDLTLEYIHAHRNVKGKNLYAQARYYKKATGELPALYLADENESKWPGIFIFAFGLVLFLTGTISFFV